jgi:predicted SPOUT superfamily RNA methylase MTH1
MASKSVSVAVPSTFISHLHSGEEKTLLLGHFTKALINYGVHEVHIYDSSISSDDENQATGDSSSISKILEYFECPPYLRKAVFAQHLQEEEALQFVNLVPPMYSVHHPPKSEWCRFREGVILDDLKTVDIGLWKVGHLVGETPEGLTKNTRVTFEFEKDITKDSEKFYGKIVDSMKPVTESKMRYSWGFTINTATSLDEILLAKKDSVKVLCSAKEGLNFKQAESKLNGALTKSSNLLLVLMPDELPQKKTRVEYNPDQAGAEEDGGDKKPLKKKPRKAPAPHKEEFLSKFDVQLNCIEFAQSKFVRVEELLQAALAVTRTSVVAWMKKSKF